MANQIPKAVPMQTLIEGMKVEELQAVLREIFARLTALEKAASKP